ncbi:MAG TPA: quercetin 2,3-dioxygenase [Acidimicrobiales bacterium]
MTLNLAADAYVLESTEGEALWFADALITYKATGKETDGGLTVAEVRAPRGAGSPRHRHQLEDEAWYVLSGELSFWLGDDVRTAGPATFVFGPREVEHRFRVDSEEAHFLLLLTPAGFEDFTRSCGWSATALTMPPADLPERPTADLQDAARRHRIELIPDASPISGQGATP